MEGTHEKVERAMKKPETTVKMIAAYRASFDSLLRSNRVSYRGNFHIETNVRRTLAM